MFLAQISDTHFRSRGEKLYGFIDVNAHNAQVVSQLNALPERPDAVIVSGDIVNCGLPQEYRVAQQTLSHLDYPLYLIPGNHDHKHHFLEMMHPLCPLLGDDAANMRYVVDDYAVRLLFIDSSQEGKSEGYLSAATLAWLTQQLEQGKDKPSAIFMHHPPIACGSAHMDPLRCINGDSLLQLIERFPALCRVFCGHNHRLIFTQYRQAIIATVPGTVHQVPYFHHDATSYYNLEPAACLMHRLVDQHWISYLHSLAPTSASYIYHAAQSCPLGDE